MPRRWLQLPRLRWNEPVVPDFARQARTAGPTLYRVPDREKHAVAIRVPVVIPEAELLDAFRGEGRGARLVAPDMVREPVL